MTVSAKRVDAEAAEESEVLEESEVVEENDVADEQEIVEVSPEAHASTDANEPSIGSKSDQNLVQKKEDSVFPESCSIMASRSWAAVGRSLGDYVLVALTQAKGTLFFLGD